MIRTIIVEDDPMVSFIHNQYLEKNPNVRVIACFNNAKDAWSYICKYSIDLIILDVYMPEMTGLSLLQKMRANEDRTEVIMVTADNSLADIQAAMSLGVLDYLVKPFEPDRLNYAIQKYISKHNISSAEATLTQEEIDVMLSPDNPALHHGGQQMDKGIQQTTLKMLMDCLKRHSGERVSCDVLADQSGLSKVTVRRYMNHLIQEDKVKSIIDYQTGGRPRITYQLLD